LSAFRHANLGESEGEKPLIAVAQSALCPSARFSISFHDTIATAIETAADEAIIAASGSRETEAPASAGSGRRR
jgi:hypothetical protein